MRIAQVSPLFERVPPKQYGGTERIVSYLSEELKKAGHEVTLYASADSQTSGELIGTGALCLREAGKVEQSVAYHFLQLEKVFRDALQFDIIHFHVDYLHFPFTRRQRPAHLTTLHGRLDLPELVPLYQEYREMPVVSISDSQRSPLPWLPWAGTVLHGLPLDLYQPHDRSQGYLAFLGRVSPEKGLDRAIRIADSIGRRLRVAAKVDQADKHYFESSIAPMLAESRNVEFIGEIGDSEKNDFLGGADALLFPINWPEPFGLVMIEAMACGTPIIAFNGGSVSEIIRPGINGFIVGDIGQAAEAVRQLPRLCRVRCRQYFEEKFSAARMARDYVRLYEEQIRMMRKRFRPSVGVAKSAGSSSCEELPAELGIGTNVDCNSESVGLTGGVTSSGAKSWALPRRVTPAALNIGRSQEEERIARGSRGRAHTSSELPPL